MWDRAVDNTKNVQGFIRRRTINGTPITCPGAGSACPGVVNYLPILQFSMGGRGVLSESFTTCPDI
jgi:hypothetical protein